MKNLIKEKQLKNIIKGIRHIANSGDGASIQLSNKSCKCLSEKIEKLEEENKKIKDPSNYYQYASKSVKNNCESLQHRIDKAIEYIHNNQPVFELSSKKQIQDWFEKEYYVELLKILRGDKE